MILAQYAIIALCLFGITNARWGVKNPRPEPVEYPDEAWSVPSANGLWGGIVGRSAAVEDWVEGPYEPYGWEPSKAYNPGTRFNIKKFGLSFGLKNRFRFRFILIHV